MTESRQWYIRTGDGLEYGPTDLEYLIACARDGRIDSTCFLSSDKIKWIAASSFPELEIQWICETQNGQLAGPFHKDHIAELVKQSVISTPVRLYRPGDPKKEVEQAELAKKLAASQQETAAEKARGEQLAAELAAAQKAKAAAEAKGARLAEELTAAKDEGKALLVSFAEAQKQSLELAAKLHAANQAKAAESASIVDLRKQLAKAQESGGRLETALKAAAAESSSLAEKLAKSRAETEAKERDCQAQAQKAAAKAASLVAELEQARLETATERKKGGELTAELGKSRQLVQAIALELKNLKAETVGEKSRGKRLAAELQAAQQRAIELAARIDAVNREIAAAREKNGQLANNLSTANKEKEAGSVKVRNLQAQLEDAERKIKELEKFKNPKNPLMSLFSKDSAADLSALEQAARRELSAMKRPRGVPPRPFKRSRSDIIDV